MVVFSVLRATHVGLRSLQTPVLRHFLGCSRKTAKCLVPTGTRGMSEHRVIQILPSKYEYTKWKDMLHFYVLLGLIPIGIVVFSANVFIGHAELTDIPEGYFPENYEYHSSPITRFLTKYFYTNPQREYEKMCHSLYHENKVLELRRMEKKVKMLMAQRGDYKGWYYMPANDRHVYVAREYEDQLKENSGSGPV